jgi:hypothetical protein
MIDIHAPHETVHTWRDFFIHIATIIVGLVIAIGLEQTVEFLHRASERRALIVDLHEECARNMEVFSRNLDHYQLQRAWILAILETLNHAQPQNGVITVSLPERAADVVVTAPSRSVWSVAKANGRVALLPENVAEVYDRVDHQGEEFFLANREHNDATYPLKEFGIRLGVRIVPGTKLKLSIADRDDLVRKFSRALAVQDACANWISFWAGASQAVLDGVHDRAGMDKYIVPGRLAHGHPSP